MSLRHTFPVHMTLSLFVKHGSCVHAGDMEHQSSVTCMGHVLMVFCFCDKRKTLPLLRLRAVRADTSVQSRRTSDVLLYTYNWNANEILTTEFEVWGIHFSKKLQFFVRSTGTYAYKYFMRQTTCRTLLAIFKDRVVRWFKLKGAYCVFYLKGRL